VTRPATLHLTAAAMRAATAKSVSVG
jgi:hypothetical protein